MKTYFKEIDIDFVQLDFENPRIASILEMYKPETINAAMIALALNDQGKTTSYDSLRDSIKTNGGIINPIAVKKIGENRYLVIEGNTRVQIYKDFLKNGVPGTWNKIISIVHEDASEENIHAIRLQSHLVGPRDWTPYAKAKYLHHLYYHKMLPKEKIVDFCGGKSTEVQRLIEAYKDMEEYYKNNLDENHIFDQYEFSKFAELQNKNTKQSILSSGFSLDDFAKWVINGNVDNAQNVRKIPAILNNQNAKNTFLTYNVSEAQKVLNIEEFKENHLTEISFDDLVDELTLRLSRFEARELRELKENIRLDDRKQKILDLNYELQFIIENID